jgi:ABC-2 type transport system ATP-binding protein
MTVSIQVENVTKQFTMQYHRTLKQMAVASVKRLPLQERFLAVNDVSFTVEQGESVGLMGLNGSGKSTLLKVINGVMRPDQGSVLTRGRIAGLIATGAGFHPQLTGRENLFLNGAIMGMSEAETKRKFDAIVDFAELGKFLETPVSHYSSGMYARLGFSIAIHVDADIFLADEVLAVGDRPFKQKCMAKMQEIRQEGTTIFYVSHATASVRAMCDRVLVLESGHLTYDSKVVEGGSIDGGIRHLQYDDPDTEVNATDEELGADNLRHIERQMSNYTRVIPKKYIDVIQ